MEKGLFEIIEEHKNEIFVSKQELEVVVPQHKHTQGHILIVLNGVATMDVERSAYYIPNGYFVWIPPQVSHRISFDSKRIKLVNIYYPVEFCEDTFYRQVGVYPIPSLLYHTFEMVQEHTEVYTKENWQYELLVTLNHILPHITMKMSFQLRLPTTNNPSVQKILDNIHNNYQYPITAQKVSKEVGMSVRTLSRYLKSELNVTFIQYLRAFRIMMAIKQMVKEEDTITNISYNVGYESLTAFSNSFYKVTGQRPSLFSLKKEHE